MQVIFPSSPEHPCQMHCAEGSDKTQKPHSRPFCGCPSVSTLSISLDCDKDPRRRFRFLSDCKPSSITYDDDACLNTAVLSSPHVTLDASGSRMKSTTCLRFDSSGANSSSEVPLRRDVSTFCPRTCPYFSILRKPESVDIRSRLERPSNLKKTLLIDRRFYLRVARDRRQFDSSIGSYRERKNRLFYKRNHSSLVLPIYPP